MNSNRTIQCTNCKWKWIKEELDNGKCPNCKEEIL